MLTALGTVGRIRSMRTVFLADAHLRYPDDTGYRLLLRFLDQLQGATDMLCILGDLFDFRVGLPALAFAEQEPILAALRRLSDGGVRIVYLEGNHDFQLGSSFARQIGAELYSRPVTLELDGKRVYLCHGDLVNPADWRYRLLYLVLRSRLTLLGARLVPAGLVLGVRSRLQTTSRKRYRTNRRRWNYAAIIRRFAAVRRAAGDDAVVLGHFHLPFLDQEPDFTLLSLGDWDERLSYGLLDDGRFSLCSFSAAPDPSPVPAG